MGFDDAARDVEPEPRTSAIILADLPEPLEDQLEHFRRDTDAVVFDGEVQRIVVARRLER